MFGANASIKPQITSSENGPFSLDPSMDKLLNPLCFQKLISFHTLQGMWLFIHAEIEYTC